MAGETIFALSSGQPPAAVSLIRVTGPRGSKPGEAIADTLPEPRHAAVRALRHPQSGDLLDDALVLLFAAPASATGEDIVEFQCHGGRAVVDAVLAALGAIDGLRLAQPGEFTRRAFDNGRIDLTEAEGLADLIHAETESQRKAALGLAEGGLKRQIAEWQGKLLGLSAAAERAIEYDDEDEAADPALAAGCAALAAELGTWLDRPRLVPLKSGLRVVVAGPPNAGKSSLINAIVGSDRVIVSDIPGTTRDFVEIPLALEGVPIILTDTAGLRDSAERVEAEGIARARSLVESADILLWLGDPVDMPGHPDAIAVHAKSDLPERPAPSASLATSAVTGAGIRDLLEAVAERGKALLPAEGAIAINRRQAAELEGARHALVDAAAVPDTILVAENLRSARAAFDRITGRAGVEDLLDALFSRFCLGK